MSCKANPFCRIHSPAVRRSTLSRANAGEQLRLSSEGLWNYWKVTIQGCFVERVVSWRLEEQKIRANEIVWSALVGAAAANAAWREAQHDLLLMRKSQIHANDICQNAAITSSSQAREWLNSVSLFSAMGSHTAVSFASFMTSLDDWRWPLSLFSQLFSDGLEGDPFVTSTAVAACASLAWEFSLNLCCAPAGGSAASYNILMDAFSKNGRWEQALRLLGKMQQSFVRISTNTFAILIGASGMHWTLSVQLHDDMTNACIPPNAFSSCAMINACSSSGRWEWALHFFTKLDEKSHDTVSYSAIISACEQGGQWELAIDLMSSATEMALEPNTVMYNTLLSAAQTGSQWRSALNVMTNMRSLSLKLDIISSNTAMSAFEASSLWQISVMIKSFSNFSLQPDEIAYNTMISSFDGQQWSLALLAMTEMTCQEVLPSNITLDATTHALQGSSEWILAIAQLTRTWGQVSGWLNTQTQLNLTKCPQNRFFFFFIKS